MKGFGTKAIHAGLEPDPSTGAVMTPIYQTSTYAQEAPGVHKGFEYSRTHNPTRKALENNLAALEGGKHGLVFASGLAAIDTLLKTLHPGDEVISTNDLYGGTYRLFVKVYEKLGLKFHFVPMQDLSSIEKKINEKTRLIWVETPTNPMLNVIDIESVATLAKSKGGILLAVDNTFSSPYLQQPLKLGADVVMHSATKYIGGHSDLVMGALITSNDNLAEQLYFLQNAAGAIPGPMDCFLALRGIKTLHIRMQRHCENAEKIARFLRSHPKVEKVFWPGFPDHPGHDIAKKQMRAFGGMISFTIKGDRVEDAFKAISSLKIFTLAESLGGVESLAGHPATMTHASIPKAERLKSGLSDSLIRLSIGLEDAEDLIADLKHVLQ